MVGAHHLYMPLSRVIVRERKIYRDAIAGGRGVIEMGKYLSTPRNRARGGLSNRSAASPEV
jgi:hypothetical protein